MQPTGYYYTSLPKFNLTFSALNEQNLMTVNGRGDNIEGNYQITGDYDPHSSYLHLKQQTNWREINIKLTWSSARNKFEGIWKTNYNKAGTFYMKAVKERVYDVNLRIEDILKDPVVIYSRESTQTTLMKGIYEGDQAVAKVFTVNRKD